MDLPELLQLFAEGATGVETKEMIGVVLTRADGIVVDQLLPYALIDRLEDDGLIECRDGVFLVTEAGSSRAG